MGYCEEVSVGARIRRLGAWVFVLGSIFSVGFAFVLGTGVATFYFGGVDLNLMKPMGFVVFWGIFAAQFVVFCLAVARLTPWLIYENPELSDLVDRIAERRPIEASPGQLSIAQQVGELSDPTQH